MLISPHEQERLLIHVAAGLARERRIEEAPAAELPMARRYFLF